MKPSAPLVTLPLEHQVEAAIRLGDNLDLEMLRQSSASAYQEIVSQLSRVRQELQELEQCLGAANLPDWTASESLQAVETLVVAAGRLYGLSAPELPPADHEQPDGQEGASWPH